MDKINLIEERAGIWATKRHGLEKKEIVVELTAKGIGNMQFVISFDQADVLGKELLAIIKRNSK